VISQWHHIIHKIVPANLAPCYTCWWEFSGAQVRNVFPHTWQDVLHPKTRCTTEYRTWLSTARYGTHLKTRDNGQEIKKKANISEESSCSSTLECMYVDHTICIYYIKTALTRLEIVEVCFYMYKVCKYTKHCFFNIFYTHQYLVEISTDFQLLY
jgi:hypothetical protein